MVEQNYSAYSSAEGDDMQDTIDEVSVRRPPHNMVLQFSEHYTVYSAQYIDVGYNLQHVDVTFLDRVMSPPTS